MKNVYYLLFLVVLTGLSLYLTSCCADNTCAEDDIYGKTIIRQTDTLYNVVPKVVRGPYFVQLGAFANRGNAENFMYDAGRKFAEQVKIIQTEDGIYRVVTGEYKTVDEAKDLLGTAKQKGYGDSFIRDQFGPVSR